ncbi:MAG: hypothetical protein JRI68_12380 [Deltaproteobacteria bacterium]|nr:hypothetical protein [Deltaproteobacteria bacterium]
MLAHPLVAAVVLVDTLTLVLLAPAAAAAIRVVLGWAPERTHAAQLRLETQAERASVLARYAALCLVVASACLVVAVTVVLPDLVPGAMCGTGVMQATGGLGQRAIALRALAVALLAGWNVADRLNRSHPRAPLTVVGARGLLLATPFVLLAVVDTFRALWGVDLSQPVDCCAVVYDQVRPRTGAAAALLTADQWLAISGAGTVALLALASWLRVQSRGATVVSAALAVVALAWAPATAFALVDGLAAYHYEVLHHQCPWCLFLGEHYAVGYPLFGAIAWVVLEGFAAFVATRLAAGEVRVAQAARARARRAALGLIVGALVYWAVAGLPAVIWRLRFGTWMG